MSKVDSIPTPNGVGATREKAPSLEVVDSRPDVHPDLVDMEAYRENVPLWKRIWQHSLTQMLLLSVQAFCGPAMDDAIAGLGGGGLATPQTSNTATAINYTMLAIVCAFGGPLVNKLGVKWALVIGAATFPIRGASYYCNSKYGNQWFLILASFLSGTGTGFWYVAEAGSILSLAPSGLVGGGINLPFAFLISPLERVVRSDGTRIIVSESLSTKQELKQIKITATSKLILLSCIWAFCGTWSTYLADYFTVRARALSSLISPFFCIVGCFGLGFILDIKGLSQRRRAQLGLYTVVLLNMGVYIWSIVMQVRFDAHNPGAIDWDEPLYPSAFLPYFFVQTTGPLSQSYMYWLISSFATDAQSNVRNGAAFRCVEAVGQAVSYGLNTNANLSTLVGFCVTFGLMAVALGPMIVLTNDVPDRIPADVLAEEDQATIEGKKEDKNANSV
ncbi:UNC93-like protein 2 [Diaporthe amygdali]|uniref:UNC93-like protein 2 n=1 Tax=Phomopsis amygdali TaxID=1214568 RepID=UPI0022FDC446|nr:UNC93-like protein 2 [Diaporthe amygdali]KAJ0107791.1 UNC93-like protein 2 [Diaporthe amygdali]